MHRRRISPAVSFLNGLTFERGPQDDLVEIAVGEAMLVHVPQLVVGVEGLVQVVQDQAAEVAVVDQSGPALVAGLLDEEVPQRDRQPSLGLQRASRSG